MLFCRVRPPGFQCLQVLQKAVTAALPGLQLGQAPAACPHEVPALVPEPRLHRLLRAQQLLRMQPQPGSPWADCARADYSRLQGLSFPGACGLSA